MCTRHVVAPGQGRCNGWCVMVICMQSRAIVGYSVFPLSREDDDHGDDHHHTVRIFETYLRYNSKDLLLLGCRESNDGREE